MIPTLRFLVGASALGLAGYLLEVARPGWLTQMGPELVALPELRTTLHEELHWGRQLDEQSLVLVVRGEAKRQLVQELLAGERGLLETAQAFQEMERENPPGQQERFRAAWPGDTDLERFCQQILRTAEWELADQPARAKEVIGRLHAEFAAAQESDVFCLLR